MDLQDQISSSTIVLKKTEDLIPYARNVRTHDDWQIQQIVSSIKEFGFTNPVLVDESNEIIAGHGRVMAASKLSLDLLPCIVLAHLTRTQKRAYALADNKIALNSGWNVDLLTLELQALNDEGFTEYSTLGFNDIELATYLSDVEATTAEDVDKEDEWAGMPDYEDSGPAHRKIIVNFESDEDVEAFFKLIGQEHTAKTKSIWYPFKERRDLESMRWVDEHHSSDEVQIDVE